MAEKKENEKQKTVYKDTNKESKNKKGKQLETKQFSCTTQKLLHLCAWILLTIGLCIVVTAFYLTIQLNANCVDQVIDDNNDTAIDDAGADLQVKPSDDDKEQFNNITGRFGHHKVHDIFGKYSNICQENTCQVACTNVSDIYTALDELLKVSSCLSIDQLVLERQEFPAGVLKNMWLPSNITVHEVIIRTSNISKIKSNAFNTYLFQNTFALTLSHMNIAKVQSGALLGLYSLKYLTIKSNIYFYESAIFQPVQTTLVNLRLNANIRLRGNRNPFDKSYLNKLVCLDLSNNRFIGPLGRKFFKSTPNLKYLSITESQIESIEEDAFEDLLGKLTFLNLAKNKLTTLAPALLRPMVKEAKISILNLANNDWLCDCNLLELTTLYQKYRPQFMDILYCKGPQHLLGISLDELDYEEQNCLVSSTTVQDTAEIKGDVEPNITEISIVTSTTDRDYSGSPTVENTSDSVHSSERTSTEANNMLKMRCFNQDARNAIDDSHSTEKQQVTGAQAEFTKADLDYLQFPAPNFNFDLQLIAENNSVIVTIENPIDLLVIWFNEAPLVNYSDTSCMRYALPELIVGPLEDNTTYTFCLLKAFANDVTPFDCLPLHVPAKRQENIWISEDNKDFTIGMLCLIFLLSTIAGGLIAYFGIKTYPDLLEGSKNVLVVKKPDQACYVATISETEYQKQSSVKKKKLNVKDTSLKKQPSIKLPLPDTPPIENSPTPFPMSVKDLERLASLKSSSTCFEDTFPSYTFTAVDDEYETPKVCTTSEYKVEQRCVENIYGMSPKSPPPLPKRNSNVSNSPTLVLNRFSSKME